MTQHAVGLIGGIATGKSLASQYFQDLGIDVIDSDQVAREVVAPGSAALQDIVKHFGKNILTPAKELDRLALRELIFSHPAQRIWLENLLHPLIRERIDAAVEKSSTPYCVVAIPLLKKREDYPKLKTLIMLDTPHHLQIERLTARDCTDATKAQEIIAAQPSRAERLAIADVVIHNDSTPEMLKQKIMTFDLLERKAICV